MKLYTIKSYELLCKQVIKVNNIQANLCNLIKFYSSSLTENRNKEHPLSAFFEDSQALPKKQVRTGRHWSAAELRNKSFEDLHKLWYITLKELNLLSTQKAEAKRLKLPEECFSNETRFLKCKKTLVRIKTVLSERKINFEKAREQLGEINNDNQKEVEKNFDKFNKKSD